MRKMTVVLFTVVLLLATATAYAEASSLNSRSGFEIGLSLSSYQYQEQHQGQELMSLKGPKIGLDMHATKIWPSRLFFRGDLRHAIGTVDYKSAGTGSSSGKTDYYLEFRGLVGIDLVVSPYTGFGYRYLFNDLRGNTTTGHWGYRRESNYFYLPIGLTLRTSLGSQAILMSTLEYDHLLMGKQISRFSDGPGPDRYSDVTNSQNNGYGLKLSVMYQRRDFAVGPFAHYWNIGQSNIVPEIKNGAPTEFGLVEPKNNTIEFGMKANLRF